ncbi:hypothetical protein [Methyloterricola oryzae]|uniref:hypothetical protein n=1 Tax=Methyloterricola oryzae TaxID=1495050 RepID=UPI0011AF162E|nr:hypothetical protein [Methyloterricola oryzae]
MELGTMQADLAGQWQQLAARVDALSLRERVLVGLAVLSVLFALWNNLLDEPMAARHKALEQQLQQAQTRSQALSAAASALSARAGIDPNRAVRERIEGLQARLEETEARRDRLGHEFITPEAMAGLLREILARQQGLRLISLQTEPARRLGAAEDSGTGKAKEDDETPAIYRHEMTLEIEGRYFDVLDYLRALEPQALFWDSVDYEVKAYPLARVRLKVYTLSFHKEWLSA